MMLAFSSFSDAHFHLACSARPQSFSVPYYAVTCAHGQEEFIEQEKLVFEYNGSGNVCIINSFGMHPQLPLTENADFMETLLRERRIRAVGEAGFDLFTKEYKAAVQKQEEAWNISLELAVRYTVPLVVHCRKALDRLFRDAKLLSKVSAVIFHSFPGSPADARSLLHRNINGYFSFGKPLIGGDKSAAACVRELDAERLLMETDAPYQTLKGETETNPVEIARVYETAFIMRKEIDGTLSPEDFSGKVLENFKHAYSIP